MTRRGFWRGLLATCGSLVGIGSVKAADKMATACNPSAVLETEDKPRDIVEDFCAMGPFPGYILVRREVELDLDENGMHHVKISAEYVEVYQPIKD